MTATMPDRRQVAYRGVVYGIDLLDHASFMAGTPVVVPDDYIGKTRQRGRARENQHRDDKPWSDLIVGSSHVLWEGICTEDELDDMERRLIGERSPRMNKECNLSNPARIPFAEQVRQRHERDDAAGRPRWVTLERRQRQSLLEWDERPSTRIVPDGQAGVSQWWTPVTIKVCLWSTSWVLLTSVIWGSLERHTSWPWTTNALCACLTSAALLGWGLWRRPDTWRLWRRRFRKLRRALK